MEEKGYGKKRNTYFLKEKSESESLGEPEGGQKVSGTKEEIRKRKRASRLQSFMQLF